MVPPTPKRMMWRVTEAPWRMLQRSLCCSFAAFSWFWGLVFSQYLISTRWMSRRGMLRSLGRCCLGLVALLVAGGAAEVLPVSLNCPLPLRGTHPPTLVCCFSVFAAMGLTSTKSGRLEVNLSLTGWKRGGRATWEQFYFQLFQESGDSSLTYNSSNITPAHVLHLGFLKRLLGVKKGTDTNCVLRKTGQIPIFSIGSDASYDSGTVFFSNNPFLRKLCGLSFLLQIEVIHGLIRLCTHSKISLCLSKFCMPYNLASPSIKNSSLTLCGRIIGSWKELDNLTPHDNHHSSRIVRSYHTDFGVPLGIAPGC